MDSTGEKVKEGRSTANAVMSYLTSLAEIEETYSSSLAKLSANSAYSAPLRQEGSTFKHGWSTFLSEAAHTSKVHAAFARALREKCVTQMKSLLKDMSDTKKKLVRNVQTCTKAYKQASEHLQRCKKRLAKVRSELPDKGMYARMWVCEGLYVGMSECLHVSMHVCVCMYGTAYGLHVVLCM